MDLDSLSANTSGPGHSPTNTEAASGGNDELWEDGGASSGGETLVAFEGLKWGGMVQFKMPAEGEVRVGVAAVVAASSKCVQQGQNFAEFSSSLMSSITGASDPNPLK